MLDWKEVYLDISSNFWKAWDTLAHVDTGGVRRTGICNDEFE